MADPKTYTQEEMDQLITERLERELAGLKANQQEALKEAKVAKAALKNYDGVDPEEYKTLKKAAAEAEEKRAAAEGDWKALRDQLIESNKKEVKKLTDTHTRELGDRDTKLGKLSKALDKRLVQLELAKAIAAAKGDPDLLLPYAERFVKTRETDDDFEAYLVDAAGNARVDGKGVPVSFSAFVEQDLMTKFPRAFEGTGSSGGGAARSNAGGGGRKAFNPATATGGDFLANIDKLAKGEIPVSG